MIFSVLSEGLAVVRHNRDERSAKKISCAQFCDKLSDRGIRVSDLAVIRRCLIARAIRLRSFVGIVRIIKMDPEKKWSRAVFSQPCDRPVHNLFAAPLL